MRSSPLLVALAFVSLPFAAAAPDAVPEVAPDVPAASAPIAVVTVLENEVWSWTAGYRGRTIDVPSGWNRVVLVFREAPEGDPWDRLFAAAIGGVEVLRGTTPRTDMTVRRDVTRYASLLPEGGQAYVAGYTDTYVGAMRVWLTLEFYDDASALASEPAADAVRKVTNFAGLCGGSKVTVPVTFPADAPSGATVEFYLSGHGGEEFWYLNAAYRPRVFHLRVDGVEIARATALPYTYAFLGFSGTTGDRVHAPMWWTAQRALDAAGVPDGVGEIPPYRATVEAGDLALLAGARSVEVALDPIGPGSCIWVTSVNVLLDA